MNISKWYINSILYWDYDKFQLVVSIDIEWAEIYNTIQILTKLQTGDNQFYVIKK